MENESISGINDSLYVLEGPGGISAVQIPYAGKSSPQSVIIDSGDAVSVAPKSYFNRIPLGSNCNPEYRLQNASGDQLKIFGTREAPFKLGRATIKVRTVICDVAQPLVATNDLITKGASVALGTNGSYLTHLNRKYPLDKDGKHYRIRTRYPVSSVL